MNRRFGIGVFALCAAAGILGAARAFACSTPVFRYALERWPADPYEIVVTHRGALEGEAKQASDALDAAYRDAEETANIYPRFEDLSGGGAEGAADEAKAADSPRMAAYFPPGPHSREPIWSAPLTAENVQALVDSPLRKKIAAELIGGKTAVWIFLKCGDKAKDAAALQLLQDQLKEIAPQMQPSDPMPIVYYDGTIQEAEALKIEFATLELDRGDPKEAFLVAMLMASEPDLKDYIGEPMAFPVFGQGRALFALVGPGINKDNIFEACAFLSSDCSCEVKAMNPGVDLLIKADWTKIHGPIMSEMIQMPPMMSLGAMAETAETTEKAAAADSAAKPDTPTEASERK